MHGRCAHQRIRVSEFGWIWVLVWVGGNCSPGDASIFPLDLVLGAFGGLNYPGNVRNSRRDGMLCRVGLVPGSFDGRLMAVGGVIFPFDGRFFLLDGILFPFGGVLSPVGSMLLVVAGILRAFAGYLVLKLSRDGAKGAKQHCLGRVVQMVRARKR